MGRPGVWADRLEEIHDLIGEGKNLEEIGKHFDVSRQRMYQVFTKYGIETLAKKKKNYLRDKGPDVYWLNKMLCAKKVDKSDRKYLLETLALPKECPALGIPLNYDGTGSEGYSRTDNSPSLDRIDSTKGYELGNIHVLSWRANRIKNDSTIEELGKIYKYLIMHRIENS